MAANAKYAPAPTQDPDEATWSQAPPSYQQAGSDPAVASGAPATSSSSAGDNFFYGAAEPRSSEDNVPDDFKFGGSVAEATVDIRHQFIRKVYTILTAQLAATAVVSGLSFWSEGYKAWIQTHPSLLWISVSKRASEHFCVYIYTYYPLPIHPIYRIICMRTSFAN